MFALVARGRDAYVKCSLLARAAAYDVSQTRRRARQQQTISRSNLAPQSFGLHAQAIRYAVGQRVISRTHHADSYLHSTPTILLRRSRRMTLRQTPLSLAMRSRLPTSRKPHL